MSETIVLDKKRTLQFDLQSVQDLEARMNGQPVGAIVHMLSQAGVTAIVMALWAGLKHEDEQLTPQAVTVLLERYLDEGKSLLVLARSINDALEQSQIFRGVEELPASKPKPVNTRAQKAAAAAH